MLKETLHKDKISQTTVYELHKIYSEDRTKPEDNEGRGRKRKMRTSPVEEALQTDKRATVRVYNPIYLHTPLRQHIENKQRLFVKTHLNQKTYCGVCNFQTAGKPLKLVLYN